MNYSEAIQFLYGLQLFGTRFGLENTFKLAKLAGNPQHQLRFIHVAGTNGKGSTCAMLEGIYRAAGLRVGLFTSPHLVSFRERIQVNRRLIPESDVIRLVQAIRATTTASETTLFEFTVVMALKYFAEQKCDLVIWETGLGGRLDATNIVTPLASVITNIALDHTQWLGDTLEKIATEKAGIIKPGVPVITTTNTPESFDVIKAVAWQQGSPLIQVPKHSAAYSSYSTALLGDHQNINAAITLATVDILQNQIPVMDAAVRTGLTTVNWPGRLQLIQRPGGQTILLDGAHNLAGAESLRSALNKHFANVKPVFIFGALADKNWLGICQLLAPLTAEIYAVPVASDRSANAHELAKTFHLANPSAAVAVFNNLLSALNACKNRPFVVITGSLYLVGEALEQLEPSLADRKERGLNDWRAAKTLK